MNGGGHRPDRVRAKNTSPRPGPCQTQKPFRLGWIQAGFYFGDMDFAIRLKRVFCPGRIWPWMEENFIGEKRMQKVKKQVKKWREKM